MKINAYNCTGISRTSQLINDSGYMVAITWKTKFLDLEDNLSIGPRAYQNLINLVKVWLPKTIREINADDYKKAPFLNANKNAVIFTDVESETVVPETWGDFWNYENLEVRYNSTKLDYEYYQNNK